MFDLLAVTKHEKLTKLLIYKFLKFYRKISRNGATTVLLEMEQLLIKSGNSIFKPFQFRDTDRCDIVLWGWVDWFTFLALKTHSCYIKIHLTTAIEIS